MSILPNPLRVFKIGQDLISTREIDYGADPTEVSWVEQDPHHGNLWPAEVNMRRERDPIPSAAVFPGQTRYGYALCWSRPGFEWYPYLPAVCSFHYPIFRGMTSATIISTGSGWKLRDEDIQRWSSVEFVLQKTISIVGGGQLSDLEHVVPHWPSFFAYDRLHSLEAFARKSKMASLNAFQRMLAYCSYATSYACAKGQAGSQDHDQYFSNPSMAEDLFKRFGENAAGSNIQILLKFLWATLGEIHRSRNFVGIAVSYHRQFYYPAVRIMASYGVPVYVRWHESSKLQSYVNFDQHYMLKDWVPSLDDFKILQPLPPAANSYPPLTSENLPTTDSASHPLPAQRPGSTKPKNLFTDPMEYINQRKASIQKMFENSEATQQMKDRQKAAARFGYRSRKGAFVFEFQRVDVVDPNTGNKSVAWERKKLTRYEGQLTYNAAFSTQLWYDCHLNQWNFCEEFNFTGNPTSAESDDEEDELMAICGDDTEDPNPLPPKPAHKRRRDNGTPSAHIPNHPSFHNNAVVDWSGDWGFVAAYGLTTTWEDGDGFLARRYGMADISDVPSDQKRYWNKKIGLKVASPLQDVVELYDSVVKRGSWPSTCDLSPETVSTPNAFPSPNPVNVLALTKTELGYIVAVKDGVARPWKLLISDPLTILQIEREAWCSDGRNLVFNLVQTGLPFELLLNDCIRDGDFRRHCGPVIHPDGHNPRLAEYYAYRHDLGYFLSEYPHARAAALCAGGILWRLAMDVEELKSEADIVGPFHASSCVSRVVGGERYWTPRLSAEEENVIVGVYRWAVDYTNSPKDDSWWPKPKTWVESGLYFGAWAPLDEEWYQDRRKAILNRTTNCSTNKKWKQGLKHEGRDAAAFLLAARGLAGSFLAQHRLGQHD